MNFFKRFDYLSDQVFFTFNKEGETRNKTTYGGIISIISIILMTITGIYFFIKILMRENKYLITSVETSQHLNLSETNLIPFLFRLSDHNSVPYSKSEKIFKINLKFWYGGSNSTNNNEEEKQYEYDLPIEKCDINKHFGKYKYLFEKMSDLETFYCTVPRSYKNSIYGIYGNILPFSYYNFYFSICDIEENSNCYEKEEIQSILSNVYLDMRTIDYAIKSYKKDVRELTIKSERFMLSLSVYKRIWMYLNNIQYITDNGYFFTKDEEINFFQHDSIRYDVDLRDIEKMTIKGTFLSFTVLSTGHIQRYHRKFVKIQDYMATYSGIIKAISLVSIFMNYFYSQNQYYFRLINGFIIPEKQLSKKYDEKKKKFEKEFQIKTKKNLMGNLNNNSNIIRRSVQFNLHNSQISIDKKQFKRKRNSMNNYNLQLLLNEENNMIIKRNTHERKILNCLGYILPFYLYANSQKNKNELHFCYHSINDNLNVVNVLIRLVRSERLLNTYLENENGTISHEKNGDTLHFVFNNMKKTTVPKRPRNFAIKFNSNQISENSSTLRYEIESISESRFSK